MITTTTPSVEGRKISTYLGIVTGEAILGANFFKYLFAGIRDFVGGRSAGLEGELKRSLARALGADAVVGVDLDYESMGAQGGMMMVSATGTAVKLG